MESLTSLSLFTSPYLFFRRFTLLLGAAFFATAFFLTTRRLRLGAAFFLTTRRLRLGAAFFFGAAFFRLRAAIVLLNCLFLIELQQYPTETFLYYK